MKINKLFLLASIFIAVCCITACTSEDDETDDTTAANTFDRSLMLSNWADNIIIPAYENFVEETSALRVASKTFQTEPNSEHLNALRTQWENAYVSWQNVEMFNIGPAQDVLLRSFINTYPTNTSNIEGFIQNQDYNLMDSNLNDEQGFPALDYLLYGVADTNNDIIDVYNNSTNGDHYAKYLNDVSERIDNLANEVLENWQSNYRDIFVDNSGSSANSSTNRMANIFMEFYEVRLRNGKIGFPSGVFSNGTPDPSRVEGMYSKTLSKKLSLTALDAHQDFFNGKATNTSTTAESFADYLNFLNTLKDGDSLTSLINTQYDTAKANISALDDSFYHQINTNNTALLEAFESLQDNVVFLKSDMFSALSIALEFDSGDGD